MTILFYSQKSRIYLYFCDSIAKFNEIFQIYSEFWYARELQAVLDYMEWRKFEGVINEAKQSCENSGICALDHFVDVKKLSKRANNAEVEIKDYIMAKQLMILLKEKD